MKSREPSGSDILWAYCASVIGAFCGGVVGLYLPDQPWIEILGAGLGGAIMLLIVKILHSSAAVWLLLASLLVPIYPAYYAVLADPYVRGQVLVTNIAAQLRSGPGVHYAALGVLSPGTRVELLGRSWKRVHYNLEPRGSFYNFWRQVRSGEMTGWIYGSLLEPVT